MSVTAYCKKCQSMVPMRDICTVCGQKLTRSNLYMAWKVNVIPVKSWCRWNGVMRLFLPVYFGMFLLILLLEAVCGGFVSVITMLRGSMPLYFLFLLLLTAVGTWLILLLQGPEEMHFRLDGKGITLRCYVPAGRLRAVILRGMSMQSVLPLQTKKTTIDGQLMVWEKSLAYADVRRLQLWQEQKAVLLYRPALWLSATLFCTEENYPDICAALFFAIYKQPIQET